jgi:hypothetical protein
MIAGGLLFLCAMIAAIAAILQPASRLGPLSIQIVAFALALGGIVVIAGGASKMKNGRAKIG